MACYSPLKGYKDPVTGGLTFRRKDTLSRMEVACGQCLGCRLDYSRMWAVRIVHEAAVHEFAGGNSFVTLTYRDRAQCTLEELHNGYHVPGDWSLHLKHFQDFMKRLRKAFAPQRIRYFHVGEYGRICRHGINVYEDKCSMLCNVGRPHFHACLFNCSFEDLEVYSSTNGEPRFTSPRLSRIWKYGFVDVGEVNYASAAYGARYILKKIKGVPAYDHYYSTDLDGNVVTLKREYCTMSRKPGLGEEFYRNYRDDIFPSDEVAVPGYGVVPKVPRYYEELFKKEFPLTLEEIKALRLKFKKDHEEEYSDERLYAKFRVKKRQVGFLKRTV